jgi:hypothetical protein
MALLMAVVLSLGVAVASEAAFDLAIHGGGGGGGGSSADGLTAGGGGGGGYVAYKNGVSIVAYSFGGGGGGGYNGPIAGGGAIGGGGGYQRGGDSGGFSGGAGGISYSSANADGGHGDGAGVPSGTNVGAVASGSLAAFPVFFSVTTTLGGTAPGGVNSSGGNGGNAGVTATGQKAALNELSLTNGSDGVDAAATGGTGGTASFSASSGLDAKIIKTDGAVNLTVDSLTVKKDYSLIVTGTPNNLVISSYVFDLTGASAGDVLLDITDITGLTVPTGTVSLSGSPSGGLSVGDTITLIDEGLSGSWTQSNVYLAGYTFDLELQSGALTAEVTAIAPAGGGGDGGDDGGGGGEDWSSGGCDAGFGLFGVLTLMAVALRAKRR